MIYDFPQAAWLGLAVFLFLILGWSLFQFRKRSLQKFGDKDLLPNLVVPRSSSIYWLKLFLFSLAWILLTFALMQPKGNPHYPEEDLKRTQLTQVELLKKAHEIILLIDASASMEVPDGSNQISRLEQAKEIADQIVSRLRGETVSLYAFTADTTVLSPETPDYLFVRLILRQLQINEGGTAGTDLLNSLEEIRKKYLSQPKDKTLSLFIFSDGGSETDDVQNLIKNLKGLPNLHIYTVGMGSLEGGQIPNLTSEGAPVQSRLSEELLRQLGRYYRANDYPLTTLVDRLIEAMNQEKIEEKLIPGTVSANPEENLNYDLYFQVPLGIALLFLIFYIWGPNTRKLCILFIAFSSILSANHLDDQMKEASLYFEAEDFNHAIQLYEELLKGPLSRFQKEKILYNLGTAYLLNNQPSQALFEFIAIPLGPESSPLLVRRVKTNLALAYYQEALNHAIDSPEEIFSALNDLQEAYANLQSASEAECTLVKAEGGIKCVPPLDLTELEKVIQAKMKDTYVNYVKSQKGKKKSPLQNLQELYQIAFLQPESENLKALQKILPTLSQNLQRRLDPLLKNSFSKNPAVTRFYLQVALEIVNQELISEKQDPYSILKKGYDFQLSSLTLNRLMTTMPGDERTTEVVKLVLDAQRKVVQLAEQFVESVLKTEIAQFENEQLPLKERCQVHPWDLVLPLFSKGLDEAKQAIVGSKVLMQFQEKAVGNWRNALVMLQKPKSSFKDGCGGERLVEETVRNIQEMELEDRPTQKAPAVQIKGIKPW